MCVANNNYYRLLLAPSVKTLVNDSLLLPIKALRSFPFLLFCI